MNWIDEGFLINKNRYSENSLIAELYTKERGKISGIIFGGTSKKIRNYLQIGNRLHINYTFIINCRYSAFSCCFNNSKFPDRIYFSNSSIFCSNGCSISKS